MLILVLVLSCSYVRLDTPSSSYENSILIDTDEILLHMMIEPCESALKAIKSYCVPLYSVGTETPETDVALALAQIEVAARYSCDLLLVSRR